MLWLYQRVFFGEITHEENKGLEDVNVREILTLAPLIVICFWIGLYPKPFFEMTAKSTEKIVRRRERAALGPRRGWRPPVPAAPCRPPAAAGSGGEVGRAVSLPPTRSWRSCRSCS